MDKSLPITYASSSSVYGLNTKIPFQETDRIVLQASLYGATKESNERIAHVYHHLHGLRLTPTNPNPNPYPYPYPNPHPYPNPNQARAAADGASLLHGLRPHRQARSE